MPNYIIEGGNSSFNFYEELYNDTDSDNEKENNETKTCLITGNTLRDDFIEMECGHKFNYDALFNDILNHKQKFNGMERRHLRSLEIRCPYCRNIQHNLLPYNENYKYEKIHGINYYDELLALSRDSSNRTAKWAKGVCDYEKEIVDPETKLVSIKKCSYTFVTKIASINKCFCSIHKKKGVSEHIKKVKLEKREALKKKRQAAIEAFRKAKRDAKEVEKMAKLKAREEAKAAKLKEKEDLKAAKLKAKEEAKAAKKSNAKIPKVVQSNPGENLVVAPNGTCPWILTTGKNKGNPCGCKLKESAYCGRHMGKI